MSFTLSAGELMMLIALVGGAVAAGWYKMERGDAAVRAEVSRLRHRVFNLMQHVSALHARMGMSEPDWKDGDEED
jgi:hypothetical protein